MISCEVKQDNADYSSSCISFTHTGEENGFYPTTIITTSKTWCGMKIDSFQDTAYANLQIVNKDIYTLVRGFILNNEVKYDLDYVRNKTSFSGYGVRIIEDDNEKVKYLILKKEDYENYFGGLIGMLKKEKDTSDLIESLQSNMPERYFYYRER